MLFRLRELLPFKPAGDVIIGYFVDDDVVLLSKIRIGEQTQFELLFLGLGKLAKQIFFNLMLFCLGHG